MQAVKKWAFNASGFNQYGLYRDDVLYETDEVKVLLDFLNLSITYRHTGTIPLISLS